MFRLVCSKATNHNTHNGFRRQRSSSFTHSQYWELNLQPLDYKSNSRTFSLSALRSFISTSMVCTVELYEIGVRAHEHVTPKLFRSWVKVKLEVSVICWLKKTTASAFSVYIQTCGLHECDLLLAKQEYTETNTDHPTVPILHLYQQNIDYIVQFLQFKYQKMKNVQNWLWSIRISG